MVKTLDHLLAMHCSPTLMGIKAANLVSCPVANYTDLPELIEDLNKALNTQDIYFKILCVYRQQYILFVYRRAMLNHTLNQPRIQCFLAQYGYLREKELNKKLDLLGKRIRGSNEFPHEIGLFLGYPFEDVMGFIKHQGRQYKLNGCWKVYTDTQWALAMFNRYLRCREILCAQVAKGMTIKQIFKPVSIPLPLMA